MTTECTCGCAAAVERLTARVASLERTRDAETAILSAANEEMDKYAKGRLATALARRGEDGKR